MYYQTQNKTIQLIRYLADKVISSKPFQSKPIDRSWANHVRISRTVTPDGVNKDILSDNA